MVQVRTILFTAVLSLLAIGTNAFAASEGTSRTTLESPRAGNTRVDQVGVGIQLGSMSGLNFEYWYDPSATMNATLAFTRGNTAVSLVHQWMLRDTFRGDARALVPYFGGGVLAVWANSSRDDYNFNYNNDRFAMSVQIPLGIELLPSNQRFGVFAELAPSLEVIPFTVGFLNADIGARLFF